MQPSLIKQALRNGFGTEQKMAKYLVTGGAGFFGGILKNRLLADGDNHFLVRFSAAHYFVGLGHIACELTGGEARPTKAA